MASETITRNDLTAILNEVLPPTPQADVTELNIANYVTLNSGYSFANSKLLQVLPHILFISMTVNGTIAQGQTTIGRMTAAPLATATLVAGSVSNPSASPIAPTVYPATAIFIPNGEIRVHSSAARSRVALAGFLIY